MTTNYETRRTEYEMRRIDGTRCGTTFGTISEALARVAIYGSSYWLRRISDGAIIEQSVS